MLTVSQAEIKFARASRLAADRLDLLLMQWHTSGTVEEHCGYEKGSKETRVYSGHRVHQTGRSRVVQEAR